MAAERQPYYLPAARADFVEAATRYETAREGLGARFIAGVNVAQIFATEVVGVITP